MAEDILGGIARARADMLMRGFGDLCVEIGPSTHGRLIRDAGVENAVEVLGMTVEPCSHMEGFAVRSREGSD